MDFKKTLAYYKAKRGSYAIVAVASLQYWMFDGHLGSPWLTMAMFNRASEEVGAG